MKRTFAAVILATTLIGGAAQAGSLADPILEEEFIEQATASNGGYLVPLIFIIIALPAITN